MKTILQAVSIRNFKKIDKIDLDLTGDSYLLTGPNGVGKSSVIQAIMMALNLEPVTDNLVTKGKDKGEIVLRMKRDEHEYSSTIKLRETKESIIFEVVDETKGVKVKGGPKTFLTAAAGPYVDIFKILNNQETAVGRKENEDFFLKLANLDPDKIEYYKTTLLAKESVRTATGRTRDSLQGYVAETRDKVQPEVYKEKKALDPVYAESQEFFNKNRKNISEETAKIEAAYKPKFIDKTELVKKQGELSVISEKYVSYIEAEKRGKEKLAELENAHTEITEQIKALQDKVGLILVDIADTKAKLSKVKDTILELANNESELADIKKKIETVDADNDKILDEQNQKITEAVKSVIAHNNETEAVGKEKLAVAVKAITEYNEAVDAADVYRKKLQESIDADELWRKQQQEILDIRKERTDYIMTGVFPIPDMKYDEENLQIVYQGMPLSDQLMSTGQIIKLGVALNTAYNPDGVNILAIPNASLLDEQNMKDTMAILKDHQMIGLFELVTPKGKLEIEVIKDGE